MHKVFVCCGEDFIFGVKLKSYVDERQTLGRAVRKCQLLGPYTKIGRGLLLHFQGEEVRVCFQVETHSMFDSEKRVGIKQAPIALDGLPNRPRMRHQKELREVQPARRQIELVAYPAPTGVLPRVVHLAVPPSTRPRCGASK